MMTMTEDMVGEIFFWLPVKSVSRFRCLSKVWNERISGRCDSSFRSNYLSAFVTRREARIVGSDDSPPTILGFFFQNIYNEKASYATYYRTGFLPTTTDIQVSQKKLINVDNNNNKHHHTILSLDEDPLGFILSPAQRRIINKKRKRKTGDQRIFVAASCNGFLVCSLEKLNPVSYYLCNPLTEECLPLPKPKTVMEYVAVGFVCKGYPCLDFVEYTIVRAMASGSRPICDDLPIEILCNGDNEWRQYTIVNSWGSPFYLIERCSPVILSANNDVIMCCSVMTTPNSRSGVLIFSIKNRTNTEADGESSHLQPWMIEAPGSDNNFYLLYHDYIEGLQGVLHYSRCVQGQYLERWVLNMDNREWVCKNRVGFARMIERSPWIEPQVWGYQQQKYSCRFLGFHPTNPNMIFLEIDHKKMWCNMESESLERAPHYAEQCFGDNHFCFAYQWPCWPPLL